jgi:hypothetical protein
LSVHGWTGSLVEVRVGRGTAGGLALGSLDGKVGEGEGEESVCMPDICMERKYFVAAWRSCSRSSAVCRLPTSISIYKHSRLQAFPFTSIPIYKHSHLQAFLLTSIPVDKHSC